jgi:D-alanyl-D-alanine carboxypeptidase
MLGLPPATKDAPKAAPAAQPAAREHNERTAVLRPPVDQPTTHLRTPEPRDPLSLLAQLTNKPAPPPTPLRTFLRRVTIWTPLVVLLLVIVGVAQALRPLPEPSLELTAAASHTFDGETPAVPWPETGQAALDVEGLGTFGSAGEQEPVPIASVAKVMTAYILLRDHPMEEDGDGVEIPVDQLAEDEAGLSSEGESTVEVEAGTSLTQREALQAIMLASANNVARLVARWSAGSEEAFVAEMNETAAELGMTDTTYTDASGLTETTVSTARDQVILAHEAMRDPVFRQIVRMPSYEASNGETYQNWNWLVPLDGVVGIKTGTTTAAGGNLMFAAEQEVGGETQLIVGAVLSQPADAVENSILRGALNAGDALIQFAQEQLRAETLFQAGDVVGFVDDGLGGRTPVSVAEDVAVAGWAGLEVTVELEAPEDGVPGSAEAGTEVGTLTAGSTSVPVVLAGDLSEPALGDRLTRIA